MKMTKELVEDLRVLHKKMKESELEEFMNQIRDTGVKFDLSYQKILNLLLDEDKLHSTVVEEVYYIDKEIEQLEKKLEELRNKKLSLGSLICEFHGHVYFEKDIDDDKYYCKNCGESRYHIDSKLFAEKKYIKEKTIFYKGERE